MNFILEDPWRKLRRKNQHDIVLQDVQSLSDGPDELTDHLHLCLQVKGFCTVSCKVPSVLLDAACSEVQSFRKAGKLQSTPQVVQHGMLGTEVSQQHYELSDLDELTSLPAIDEMIGSIARRRCSDESTFWSSRTSSYVLSTASDDAAAAAEMSTKELYKWWSLFLSTKVMACVFLGPGDSFLELKPHGGEANAVELVIQPGSILLFRPQALQAKLVPRDLRACVMTSFLVIDRALAPLELEPSVDMSPPAQELHTKIIQCIKDMKMEEEEYSDYSTVPRELVRAMNHFYYRRQQVAIRGMATRNPASWSLESCLSIGAMGADVVTAVPLLRWDHWTVYDPDEFGYQQTTPKTSCNHASFVEGIHLFDNKAFGISNVEAGGMDPNQRHVLEVGYESLHRGGLNKKELMNLICGVFIGMSIGDWGCREIAADVGVHGATGAAPSICCGRFSFCHGLRGASVAIDTEGAASLTAAYWAADAVQQKGRGRVHDWAMAAGTKIMAAKYYWPALSAQGFLSRAGRCFVTDASADGCVMSDGIGAVSLRGWNGLVTYDDDGNVVESMEESPNDSPFEGFMVGGAVNTSGKSSAMTIPSASSFEEVACEAARLAGLQPGDIDAVELHAGSKLMDDALEVMAVSKALRLKHLDDSLMLSSSKTLWGNAVEGAGLLALAMVLGSLKRGAVSPLNHIHQLNPYIDMLDCVEVVSEPLSYRSRNDFVGVQAHGLGGSNVHLVFFGNPPKQTSNAVTDAERPALEYWPAT